MIKFISVKDCDFGFKECLQSNDCDNASDYYESLKVHYKNRGKQIKKLKEEIKKIKYQITNNVLYDKRARQVNLYWCAEQVEKEILKHNLSCNNICSIASHLRSRIGEIGEMFKEEKIEGEK